MGPGAMSWAMNPAERKTPAPIMLAATSPIPERTPSFLLAGGGTAAWYMASMPTSCLRAASRAAVLGRRCRRAGRLLRSGEGALPARHLHRRRPPARARREDRRGLLRAPGEGDRGGPEARRGGGQLHRQAGAGRPPDDGRLPVRRRGPAQRPHRLPERARRDDALARARRRPAPPP